MARIRFLQTSDAHLREDRPERARALSLVFDLARTRSADVVLVVGDLFDRASDTVGQRAYVRHLIESIAPRPVVLLPGNHDAACYGPDADYGANAIVLAETPAACTTVCGVDIIGIPYQHGMTLAECLTGVTGDPRSTVVMAHGTLVDGVAGAFAGEGEGGAYVPIFLSDVLRRCCYAALGHLHAGRNLVHRDGERLVAYAGSPAATSRLEIGPRGALLVDFEPSVGVLAHEHLPVATPFFDQVEIHCTPGAEGEAVERLAREAVARKRPGARVRATLSGVTFAANSELRDAASRALARAFSGATAPTPTTLPRSSDEPDASLPILELETISYPSLAEIPIVGEFVERLEAAARSEGVDDPATLDAALRLGLDAFLELVP